jgi:hypothetical protein
MLPTLYHLCNHHSHHHHHPAAFIGYAVFATLVMVFLVFFVAPTHGQTNLFVYLGICSLAGSLTVMGCKALGIALKLTFQGDNQLVYAETHFCLLV